MKGALDKGGSSRRDALETARADVGGSLDTFYFAFGADDVFVTSTRRTTPRSPPCAPVCRPPDWAPVVSEIDA
jgi:hypothetical protein